MTTDRNSEGSVECLICGGEGADPEFAIVPRCCGRADPNGDCCGNPEPEQVMQPCRQCSGFGKLYTTPPASIPAAEVLALVERWRKCGPLLVESQEVIYAHCADELAKLIPRGT